MSNVVHNHLDKFFLFGGFTKLRDSIIRPHIDLLFWARLGKIVLVLFQNNKHFIYTRARALVTVFTCTVNVNHYFNA